MAIFSSNAIVSHARAYIGTPFVIGGRTKWGMDCAGLLLISATECGADDAEPEAYGKTFSQELMLAGLNNLGRRLGKDEQPHAGDILLFNLLGSRQHLAMITLADPVNGILAMIHSYQTVGKVVEHPVDRYWFTRIDSIWRWREADWEV